MSDNFVLIDNIYRSRMNLLDILEERGYIVDKYRKFSPTEATAAIESLSSLSFKVLNKDEINVCDVRYANVTRQKLDKFFDDIEDEKSETTEVIVMMIVPIGDAHHMVALRQYLKNQERKENYACHSLV